MRKVRARIKAPVGEIVIEADSPHKILETARKIKTNTGMCRTCNVQYKCNVTDAHSAAAQNSLETRK